MSVLGLKRILCTVDFHKTGPSKIESPVVTCFAFKPKPYATRLHPSPSKLAQKRLPTKQCTKRKYVPKMKFSQPTCHSFEISYTSDSFMYENIKHLRRQSVFSACIEHKSLRFLTIVTR